MQYSFRSAFQRNLSIMMLLIRNALAYSILDKKQMKKKLGRFNVLFQMVFYGAMLSLQRKKFWLLASSGLRSYSTCFHFKRWYPMDCLYNDNGLDALIVKQGIWMTVFYNIKGPCSGSLFCQHIWVWTLWSVGKYHDGEEGAKQD